MTTNSTLTDPAPTPGDLERDRKLEVLLDEMVAVPAGSELPADFAARILECRPFAPWEVTRSSHWRLPVGIGLGLLAGSLGLALTPLWSLGPGTAVTVWAELLAVAVGRPLATLVTALPLLLEGTGRAAEAVPPGGVVLLGVTAGVVAASLGAALVRLRRLAAPAGPRRG
jgi:hypothetical protein